MFNNTFSTQDRFKTPHQKSGTSNITSLLPYIIYINITSNEGENRVQPNIIYIRKNLKGDIARCQQYFIIKLVAYNLNLRY